MYADSAIEYETIGSNYFVSNEFNGFIMFRTHSALMHYRSPLIDV